MKLLSATLLASGLALALANPSTLREVRRLQDMESTQCYDAEGVPYTLLHSTSVCRIVRRYGRTSVTCQGYFPHSATCPEDKAIRRDCSSEYLDELCSEGFRNVEQTISKADEDGRCKCVTTETHVSSR